MKKISIALLTAASLAACEGGSSDEPAEESQLTVFEIVAAPGQFVNEDFTASTMAEACAAAKARIDAGLSVSLGAFGGYIVMGLGHTITDFAITGNCFNDANGGSNEPGIVYVMTDTNGNGKPDDGQWSPIEGSESAVTCTVTYYRPSATGSDVEWRDSEGNTGTVAYLKAFHRQDSYFPGWISGDSLVLTGLRLDSKVRFDEASGNWILPPYGYGYADNCGADMIEPGTVRFSTTGADFVKVQTAVIGSAGHLGEISTEISGFRELK